MFLPLGPAALGCGRSGGAEVPGGLLLSLLHTPESKKRIKAPPSA